MPTDFKERGLSKCLIPPNQIERSCNFDWIVPNEGGQKWVCGEIPYNNIAARSIALFFKQCGVE